MFAFLPSLCSSSRRPKSSEAELSWRRGSTFFGIFQPISGISSSFLLPIFYSGLVHVTAHHILFITLFFGTEFRPLLLPISGDLSLGVPKPTFVEVWMELEEKLSSLKVGLTDCE